MNLETTFDLLWKSCRGPALASEHRFQPARRWRFDRAHVASRTAIELEGGVYTRGRHMRVTGFIADCEKYNAAALMGWTVFRLTRADLGTEWVEKIIGHIDMRGAA